MCQAIPEPWRRLGIQEGRSLGCARLCRSLPAQWRARYWRPLSEPRRAWTRVLKDGKTLEPYIFKAFLWGLLNTRTEESRSRRTEIASTSPLIAELSTQQRLEGAGMMYATHAYSSRPVAGCSHIYGAFSTSRFYLHPGTYVPRNMAMASLTSSLASAVLFSCISITKTTEPKARSKRLGPVARAGSYGGLSCVTI